MKRVFLLLLLLVAVCVGDAVAAEMQFMGVPIAGTPQQFVDRLVSQKGFTDGTKYAKYQMLSGPDFYGMKTAFYCVNFDDNNRMTYVEVAGEARDKWQQLLSDYTTVLDRMRSIPGIKLVSSTNCKFSGGYREGDGREMDAVKNGDLDCRAEFSVPGGRIKIYISVTACVWVEFWPDEVPAYSSSGQGSGTSSSGAMEIFGVPVTSSTNAESFIRSLGRKGFSVRSNQSTYTNLDGPDYYGLTVSFYSVDFESDGNVRDFQVFVRNATSWRQAKGNYETVVNAIKRMPGAVVTSQRQEFESPYRLGGGNEMAALEAGKVHYRTEFNLDGGTANVYIMDDAGVVATFYPGRPSGSAGGTGSRSVSSTGTPVMFEGVPVKGTLTDFANKLVSQKGFSIVERGNGYTLKGTVLGYKVNEVYINPEDDGNYSQPVNRINVYFAETTNWRALKSMYNAIVAKAAALPGWVKKGSTAEFEAPYREGDGDEMAAVKAEHIDYNTAFDIPGGVAIVSITKYMQVNLFIGVNEGGTSTAAPSSTSSGDALLFMGLPMRGSVEAFANRLVSSKGFRIVEGKNSNQCVSMRGTFTGKDCEVYLFGTDRSERVFKIDVYLPKQSSWSAIKAEYLKYKAEFDRKYELVESSETFEGSASGREVQAIEDGRCKWEAFYRADGGFVKISISKYMQVKIAYFDSEGVQLQESEEGGSSSSSGMGDI